VVFTAEEIQVEVFWVLTPCSDVVGINVSEDDLATIFRVKMGAAKSPETMISHHITTRRQNP
jgi:hypothetical protein